MATPAVAVRMWRVEDTDILEEGPGSAGRVARIKSAEGEQIEVERRNLENVKVRRLVVQPFAAWVQHSIPGPMFHRAGDVSGGYEQRRSKGSRADTDSNKQASPRIPPLLVRN